MTKPEGARNVHADSGDARFWQAVEGQDLQALAETIGTGHHEALAQVLPALTDWYRGRTSRAEADSLRYAIAWRPVNPPAGAALSGTWIVAAAPGQERLAASAARMLTEHGACAAPLTDGEEGATRAELGAVLRSHGRELSGVLSLLPATGTLRLLQALADSEAAAPLWAVTQGAVSTGSSDPLTAPGQAPVWGLGQVAGLEFPRLWGGLIDLPTAVDAQARSRWAGVLGGGLRGEDQLTIRPAGLLARRLVPVLATAGPADVWQAHGTVLVTGGTGPVGTEVARALAEWGAEHLVLTSTREVPARRREELRAELAESGTRTTFVVCDPADRAQLAAVSAVITADAPLTAVVHTEDTREEYALEGIDPELFEGLVRAQTAAAWNLHEFTAGTDVSAFVLFSSIASAFGAGPGLAAYAAGHAYHDALAVHRSGLGEPATAIGWGLWESDVLSGDEDTDAERLDRLRGRGTPAMAPARAVEALRAALGRAAGEESGPVTVVADVDWERYLDTLSDERPLLAEVPQVRRVRQEREQRRGGSGAEAVALLADLAGREPAERRALVLDAVRTHTAAVLHRDPAAIGLGRAFLEMGLDSLTTVELRNRLSAATGLRIAARKIFELRTPDELTDYILTEVLAGTEGRTDSPAGGESPAGSTIRAQFERSLLHGDLTGLSEAARLRDTFEHPGPGDIPESVLLAQGCEKPALICFPTMLATSGCHQYARLAAPFAGTRDVAAVSLPGFLPGERVPGSLGALVDAAAEAVLRRAAGGPFVLVGYSSGGILAHAVAQRLEERAHAVPEGLVLLDTYPPDSGLLARTAPGLLAAMAGRAGEVVPLDDTRLTAMGAYLSLVTDWQPGAIETPALLVRAARPLTESADEERRAVWPLPHWSVDVPGDHFDLIEDSAHKTAASMAAWLDGALCQASCPAVR
ncbi:alpha/beta fold hydrolase [Streptomyces sp. NPDC102441]|uniref:alpha/beta fold hydrolase n=1 Tax=Streptomyces sp. NPDC102441 TaxID=3366176 RepID=UPI00380C3B35